ncbi:MAG: glycosyltransferase family 4 protein [Actinobacteria bacterium]|nr:glycosyltransferase family 4 protein [Actinomycetota bacterium]
MDIWIACVSEPLPVDEGGQRRMRAGMLASTLAARRHKVMWWTSAFNHTSKRLRVPRSQTVTAEGIELALLYGRSYSRNISVARLVNHYQVAREFAELSKRRPKPDAIFCCWPTVELGWAVVRYARRHDVPVVLDVRDLWPDLFLDAVPEWARRPARVALAPYYHATRFAFHHASAIVGISEQYLNWGLSCAQRPRQPWDAVFPLGYSAPDLSGRPNVEHRERFRLLGIDDSRLVCWFLGSFGDTYDLETVIGAARVLKHQGVTECQFVLSGEGERRARCEEIAARLDNVVFTGWLNREEITSMMQMAHVGLAAYRPGAPQGLPNKIFEYMAAGLPILSSLSGECEQFLKANGCGISYTPGSVDSLVGALRVLRKDADLRTKLGANGRAAFRSRYSASVVYPRLAEYLERLGTGATSTGSLRSGEVC